MSFFMPRLYKELYRMTCSKVYVLLQLERWVLAFATNAADRVTTPVNVPNPGRSRQWQPWLFPRAREKCYKCNRLGHFARDCKEDSERCYRCNGEGHFAKDCQQSPDTPSCYNCNKPGHIARACPESGRWTGWADRLVISVISPDICLGIVRIARKHVTHVTNRGTSVVTAT